MAGPHTIRDVSSVKPTSETLTHIPQIISDANRSPVLLCRGAYNTLFIISLHPSRNCPRPFRCHGERRDDPSSASDDQSSFVNAFDHGNPDNDIPPTVLFTTLLLTRRFLYHVYPNQSIYFQRRTHGDCALSTRFNARPTSCGPRLDSKFSSCTVNGILSNRTVVVCILLYCLYTLIPRSKIPYL